MGKALQSLLIILFALAGQVCYSQTSVNVSDPRLAVSENKLVITYDILEGNPGEKYIISIDIKDEDGHMIRANTLEGDIGELDTGGLNKRIVWDPAADNIFIDSKIYIKVNAKIIAPPVAATVPPESNQESANSLNGAKEYSRAGLVIQSLVLPGLGLTRLTGKPHWLRGVAAYGCLAGAVSMNRVSLNTYGGIGDLLEYEEKDALYEKALTQNQVAQGLAYTAAAIWVADIVWTLVGTSDLEHSSQSGQAKGFSINGKLDPMSNIPLLSMNYRF